MSIRIDPAKCAGCGKCADICPGNLIIRDGQGRAVLPCPEDCWGCASCLKECRHGAIAYYLGADMGGNGAELRVRSDGPLSRWTIQRPGEAAVTITVDRRKANSY
ncbi:MAG: 4Fe-4S binding protein [Oscillibacter sp.]|nr:4Fe-4S binding protein [Oscillibacter sp.]